MGGHRFTIAAAGAGHNLKDETGRSAVGDQFDVGQVKSVGEILTRGREIRATDRPNTTSD